MIHGTLREAADWAGGTLIGQDADFRGLAIDSRAVEPQQLFVALAGERTDGHRYAGAAIADGAAAALVERETDLEGAQIRVGSTRESLGRLAGAWRSRFALPVIGVTGSNGKTTVKAMLRDMLARRRHCLANEGNFNNEIGLPLTLAKLDKTHAVAVLEMGAARPGDITYLAGLARPTIGVVINAAPAHLEGMGSVKDVARTKGELVAALPDDGCAVINADDDHADFWRELAGGRKVVTFGLEAAADVVGRYETDGDQRSLTIRTPAWETTAHLKLPGTHNASNALAATAAAIQLDVAAEDVVAALESFVSVTGRLQLRPQPGGWLLLEDSYNANPASLAAGVTVLVEQPGERWLVLGDMAELGADAEALHFQAGSNARRQGVERLFAVGPLTRHAVQAFGDGATHYASKEDLTDALKGALKSGVVCLIKGSRSSRMEEVSRALTGNGV